MSITHVVVGCTTLCGSAYGVLFNTYVNRHAPSHHPIISSSSPYHYQGDESGALSDLDTALSIQPDHPRALCSRAACHAIANTAESLAHAADDYARSIENNPDADTCCQRAEVLVKMERLPEAVKELTRALVLCPQHVRALRARAGVLQQIGNDAGAADDLAAAAGAAQEDVQLQLMAVHALRGQGRWEEATVACERCVVVDAGR